MYGNSNFNFVLKNIIQELHFGTGFIKIHQLVRFLYFGELSPKSRFSGRFSETGKKSFTLDFGICTKLIFGKVEPVTTL